MMTLMMMEELEKIVPVTVDNYKIIIVTFFAVIIAYSDDVDEKPSNFH